MLPRRPLSLAITLAVVMITLLLVLTVGWVLLNIILALTNAQIAGVYWALLSIGTTFIVLLVVGVVIYLALTVKAINLNRRQSNFVDSVTHELKSPIASLKLHVQTLGRRKLSEREQKSFYRNMLDDIERLDRLINLVLQAGRIEAGHVVGETEDIELAPLVRECAEMVCYRYRLPGETVCLDLARCTVRGRRIDLDLIFRNLLDNAVKYAGSPPRAEVSVRADGQTVIVQISDNGRGVPRRLRRKIFGRFFRAGLELEREKPGTGLGLYIVNNLVRRMRGSVRVVDRAGTTGAVFEVRLPGSPMAAPKPEPETARP